MAYRTTANAVKTIIDTDLSTTIVEAFIGSANTLVTSTLGSTTLSSDLLVEIEKWLAAHMIAISRERIAKEEGAGGAKVVYMGEAGTGLHSTPYGQMVLELDTTGKMASLGGKAVRMVAVRSFDF